MSVISWSLGEGTKERKKRGRPSVDGSKFPSASRLRKAPDNGSPQPDVRTDEMAHWPIHSADRPRCFYCGVKHAWVVGNAKRGIA